MASSSKKSWLPWAIVGGALLVILGLGLAAGNMLTTYDDSIGFAEEADRIAVVLELEPGMWVGDGRSSVILGCGMCGMLSLASKRTGIRRPEPTL